MLKVRQSLGESLVEAGMITADQLAKAQAEEKRTSHRLLKVLVKMNLVTEEDLVVFLSGKLGIPRIELANYLIDPAVIELVPESFARKHDLIPVLKIGNRLTCALVDPWNVFVLDELRIKTKLTIEPAVATGAEIKKAIEEHYGAKETMEELLRSIGDEKPGLETGGDETDPRKLEGIVKEPAVIKLVNLIILQAVKQGASDIHLEPEEDRLKIRFRVDGMMHEVPSPPNHLKSAVVSRIKILANLNIAERRLPQDGRFSLKIESREIDIRVSAMPTIYGENVVLRLLDPSSALLSLSQIGFPREILEKYGTLIRRPYGIILVTGPTGSGKTTTLYASLDKINSVEKNIITIEDPVEYRLSGIRQTQVNPKVNLTFANGLRSILRQDPDILMVGEIRDRDTCEIAIQAALTGHLVFSTLHTNDAAGAITRMIDMGAEPFLIASSVIGILAQRLVRKVCQDCRGKGCPKCLKTGYRGRIGIYELLIPDEKVRSLTVAKAGVDEIRKYVRSTGMTTLKENGMHQAKAGVTTPEEVLRVTQEE
ncbi:MAG: type II/IV secretion system protein [Candidatus Omnitrophica bacterium]|nr:type II/IV secretion system protein [Candidatus Omnitrophota bacterium]